MNRRQFVQGFAAGGAVGAGSEALGATRRGKVPLKITDVRVLPVDRYLFVQISTNEGITGLGESGAWGSSKLRQEPWRRSSVIWSARIRCGGSITGSISTDPRISPARRLWGP